MFNFDQFLCFAYYALFVTVLSVIPFIILCLVYKISEFDMDEGSSLETSEVASQICRNGIDLFMAVYVAVPFFVAIQTYVFYLSKDSTLLEIAILGSAAAAFIHSIDLFHKVSSTFFMKPAFFSIYLWYLMYVEIKKQ
jgi:hypothetical protein